MELVRPVMVVVEQDVPGNDREEDIEEASGVLEVGRSLRRQAARLAIIVGLWSAVARVASDSQISP